MDDRVVEEDLHALAESIRSQLVLGSSKSVWTQMAIGLMLLMTGGLSAWALDISQRLATVTERQSVNSGRIERLEDSSRQMTPEAREAFMGVKTSLDRIEKQIAQLQNDVYGRRTNLNGDVVK